MSVFRLTVISRDAVHVRVRFASRVSGQTWATNGVLTFTLTEWDVYRGMIRRLPSRMVEVVE